MFPVELSTKFFNRFIVSRGTYNAQFLRIVDKFTLWGIKYPFICRQYRLIVENFLNFFSKNSDLSPYTDYFVHFLLIKCVKPH